MSLWGGRFNKKINKTFKLFNDSLPVDYRLVEQDIIGSIAWADALSIVGILNDIEKNQIQDTLRIILEEVRISPKIMLKSKSEDIHSWVEQLLINKIGVVGKKIHTGRSRNDQITTDLKLWCKLQIINIINMIRKLQKIIIITARINQDVIMPGYTHLQRAQPITFSHWCLAYYEMFLRDISRLNDTLKRLDSSPLGSGALAGTSYPIDREQLAISLGFSSATRNSLDGVSDRDYVLEFLSNIAIGMIHLSRLSEDLIFFNTGEASFIELSDCVTSGSSLMPQKKNPDALELIRGKCGRVQGSLFSILITMKGLPLSYNKDMQEDKKGLFDSVDTWIDCISICCLLFNSIKIKNFNCYKAAQQGYSNSTDLADYLVKKGVPFREAHHIVGKIVLKAIQNKTPLELISLLEFKKFSNLISDDVYSVLNIESSLLHHNVKGGVNFEQIKQAIIEAEYELDCLI